MCNFLFFSYLLPSLLIWWELKTTNKTIKLGLPLNATRSPSARVRVCLLLVFHLNRDRVQSKKIFRPAEPPLIDFREKETEGKTEKERERELFPADFFFLSTFFFFSNCCACVCVSKKQKINDEVLEEKNEWAQKSSYCWLCVCVYCVFLHHLPKYRELWCHRDNECNRVFPTWLFGGVV